MGRNWVGLFTISPHWPCLPHSPDSSIVVIGFYYSSPSSSSTSWNNTRATEVLQLLQTDACFWTICNNYIDVQIFTPASSWRSIPDLNRCPQNNRLMPEPPSHSGADLQCYYQLTQWCESATGEKDVIPAADRLVWFGSNLSAVRSFPACRGRYHITLHNTHWAVNHTLKHWLLISSSRRNGFHYTVYPKINCVL